MPVIKSKDRDTVTYGLVGYGERVIVDAKADSKLTLGDLVFEPGSIVDWHHHDVQEAFYVFEGSTTVWLGEEEIELERGDGMLVPIGVKHKFHNRSGLPCRMVWDYAELDAATHWD
mgnify:CR=1 FL=1